MSYARFSHTSDIYVYCGAISWHCCGCFLQLGVTFSAEEPRSMADHVREHIDAGDLVPDGVVEALLSDADAYEAEADARALDNLTHRESEAF